MFVRKLRETHLVAHYLKTGWGKRNYINIEGNSCSKNDITVPSLLAPHTTHENHRSYCTDTQKETVTTSENLLPFEQ